MSDQPTYATDWESKVAFMRARCLVSAKWATVIDPITNASREVLTEAIAGPDTTPLPDADRETQPSISPQEQERRARLARRELVARSSGGPVPKLDVVG